MTGSAISRRQFIRRSIQGLGLAVSGLALAEGHGERFVVGAIVPSEVGSTAANRLENAAVAGASVRRGVLLADQQLYPRLAAIGVELLVVVGTAPDTRSAERAAARMIEREEARWVVGGFGCDEVAALSARAAASGAVFVNVASTCEEARLDAAPHVLHVEPSASMHLDAIAAWSHHADVSSWTVVAPDSAEGRARLAAARRAAEVRGIEVRGAVDFDPQAADFRDSIESHTGSGAAAMVFLGGWHHHYDILGQLEARHPETVLYALPDAVNQTRAHIDTSRYLAPTVGGGVRFSSWEPTAPTPAAAALSDMFASRWGVPMDGPAWAGYQAVAVAVEGIIGSGSTDPLAVREYLVSEATRLDVAKEAPARFDADGQLHHSTMVARVNPLATARRELRYQLEWATFVSEHVHGGG